MRRSWNSWIVPTLLVALVSTGGCQTTMRDIEITPLDDGVWLHTSYYTYPGGTRFPSNGLIVSNGESLLLIDTAWGERSTVRLLETIDARIGRPVTHAVITHSHGDRISGTDVIEERGVTVYAHPLTRQSALESGLPVPDQVFDGLKDPGSSLSYQGVEILYPGPGHSIDNLVIWLPGQKILFGGCAVRALSANSAGNLAHADLNLWLLLIEVLSSRFPDAEIVVPGHGAVGNVQLLAHTAGLLAEVHSAAKND